MKPILNLPSPISPQITPESVIESVSTYITNEDYQEVIKILGESLKILTKSLGDLHPSLFKLYFFYGDSILLQYEKENDAKVLKTPENILCSASSENNSETNKSDFSENEEQAKELKENNSETNKSDISENEEQAKELNENDSSESLDSESNPCESYQTNRLETEKAENIDKETSSKEESKENKGTENTKHARGNTENKEIQKTDQEYENKAENKETSENKEMQECGNKGKSKEVFENNDELDLQLAWENLETSRVILKQLPNADPVFLFKIYSRLGDLQSYLENFEQASEEYLSALSTLETSNSSPSKDQASIHYMIGHNYLQVKGRETDAEKHFRISYNLLESFLNTVKEPELASELNAVLKDIEEKIEDSVEQRESLQTLHKLEKVNNDEFDKAIISETQIELISRKAPTQDHIAFPSSNDSKKTFLNNSN